MAFVHCSSAQSEEASLYNAALSSLCVNTEELAKKKQQCCSTRAWLPENKTVYRAKTLGKGKIRES